MLKKLGMVTVGAAAGLVALAPIASASTCASAPQSAGEHHGHDKGHGKHQKADKAHHKATVVKSNDCTFAGGSADAASDISGDALANAVTQAPVAGNNVGNIANCSSFLNDNFSNNHDLVNIAL